MTRDDKQFVSCVFAFLFCMAVICFFPACGDTAVVTTHGDSGLVGDEEDAGVGECPYLPGGIKCAYDAHKVWYCAYEDTCKGWGK